MSLQVVLHQLYLPVQRENLGLNFLPCLPLGVVLGPVLLTDPLVLLQLIGCLLYLGLEGVDYAGRSRHVCVDWSESEDCEKTES